MGIERRNATSNKLARSGPARGLEKKKGTSIRKYKWRNTSESHTDKLDQTNMDFSHTDEVKIQNNIFNQYYIITNG